MYRGDIQIAERYSGTNGEINARELQFIKLNKLCMMQLNYFDLLFAIDMKINDAIDTYALGYAI